MNLEEIEKGFKSLRYSKREQQMNIFYQKIPQDLRVPPELVFWEKLRFFLSLKLFENPMDTVNFHSLVQHLQSLAFEESNLTSQTIPAHPGKEHSWGVLAYCLYTHYSTLRPELEELALDLSILPKDGGGCFCLGLESQATRPYTKENVETDLIPDFILNGYSYKENGQVWKPNLPPHLAQANVYPEGVADIGFNDWFVPGMLNPMLPPLPSSRLDSFAMIVHEMKKSGKTTEASVRQLLKYCKAATKPFRDTQHKSCFAILQTGRGFNFYEYYREPEPGEDFLGNFKPSKVYYPGNHFLNMAAIIPSEWKQRTEPGVGILVNSYYGHDLDGRFFFDPLDPDHSAFIHRVFQYFFLQKKPNGRLVEQYNSAGQTLNVVRI